MNQDNGQVYHFVSPSKLDKKTQLPLDSEIESSQPPQRGLNLRPYLRTAQRKILLIAGFTAITTAAAAFSMSKAPPVYQGSFQILTEAVTSEGRLADPNRIARDNQSRIGNQSEVFEQDYPTILKILTGSQIKKAITDEIRRQYPTLKSVDLKLNNSLVVQRLKQESKDVKDTQETSILEVTYQNSDPKLVKVVINTVAKTYLDYSLEERKKRINQGVDFIEDQLPSLQSRVDNYRQKLQGLQETYDLINPETTGEELFAKVRQINDEQLAVQRELNEQKALYTNLQGQLKLTPNQAINASSLSENPSYQKLLAELKAIESQIAIESARFEPDAPPIQALQEKRQNLKSLLDQEAQGVLGEGSSGTSSNSQVLAFQNSTRQALIQQLINATNQIQMLEVRNQALLRTKNAFERQAQLFPSVTSQYNEIQRQLEVTAKTFEQLLTQRETLRVEAAQKTVPWELISAPEIPLDADGNPVPQPSSSKKLMLGVVGGIVLGLGAALLYEKYCDIFYSVEDLEEITRLPIIARIPLDHRGKVSTTFRPFLRTIKENSLRNRGTSSFLKAFDSLYANIRFCFGSPPVRSLAVCSASCGDGKSTIALHLAQTAAAMGQQVLLVDANLRSPRLHTWLDLPNLEGLSDILEAKQAPNEFIQRSHLAENLFVLTSGQPLPNSPKRLASDQMGYLKEKFQSKFDLVIYDTPNLLDYTDASFLASHTDGILLVVTVRESKQSLVKQALDKLNTFGLPLLGVVANRIKSSSLTALPKVQEIDEEENQHEYLRSESG